MRLFRNFFLLSFLLISLTASAQRKPLVTPDSLYKGKEEIVIDGKRFRVWNNFFTVGAGVGYHTANPHTQIPLSANLNFHIRAHYFQLGAAISGDRFLSEFSHYQFHLGYVLRKQEVGSNRALTLGLSYVTGYRFRYDIARYEQVPYQVPGLYAEAQLIRKFAYDLGYGGSLFADMNLEYSIIGARFDIYFSNAYRGYAKGYKGKRKGDN